MPLGSRQDNDQNSFVEDPAGDTARRVFISNDATTPVPITGTISATPGPVEFVKDTVNTKVELDTATPANNEPLPVDLIDTNGQRGTSANPLRVDPTGATTQPISAASLPLPTGAATSANQLPDNHQVTVSNFPATQPISAVSLPLPTGAATEAKQDAGNTSLASIDSKVLTDTQLRASPVPISGTVTANAGTNLNTSALNLETTQVAVKNAVELIDDIPHAQNAVLNKGAPAMGQLDDTATTAAIEDRVAVPRITAQRSWHTNLRHGTTGAEMRGQQTSANSIPVVFASDQGSISTGIVNDGSLFSTANEINAATSGTDNPLLLLRNPSLSGKSLFIWRMRLASLVTNNFMIFKLFINPTVTATGTANTILNRNIGGTNPATVAQAFRIPTISVLGDLLTVAYCGQNNNSIDLFEDFAMKLNETNDLLITGNPSSNNRGAGITVVWQERL